MPDDSKKESRALSNRLNALNDRLDDVYKSTYSMDTTAKDMYNGVTDDIFDSVSKILANNTDIQGLPDIARLYTRLERKDGSSKLSGKLMDSLVDMFDNGDIMASLTSNPEMNRYIKSKDLQVDMVLKYMPKLKTALDIKKDSVLSAENFSKSFLHIINPGAKEDDDEEDVFVMQAKQLIKKYKLEEKIEDMYDDAARYGEQFIYLVPYKKAFETLEKQRNVVTKMSIPVQAPMGESVILENGNIADIDDRQFYSSAGQGTDESKLMEQLKGMNTTVKLTFNDSGTITSAINEAANAHKVYDKTRNISLNEAFLHEINNVKQKSDANLSDNGKPIDSDRISPRAAKYKFDKVAPDNIEYDKLYDKANDGLVVQNTKSLLGGDIDDMPGFVYKKLERCDVIPIYIEDVCMGYYYFEFSYFQENDIDRSKTLLNDTFSTISDNTIRRDNDMVIRYIASKISSQIDTHFINANQDLKEEIYAILKYDHKFNGAYNTNSINVTFIPPQDIFHFYFKMDDLWHRGISDLENSILSALFWVLLQLSATMGTVTRSNDHRAIYVKQNVETNIAKTMMNVINQLKKGNMGIRQMQSINNILQLVGRYNDYIIPVGPSGDAPVTFDTIPGQEIKPPEELLNRFEEQAINATGTPMEMVNTVYNVDYASRFTMANSKFLRDVLKRQEICQNKFTDLFMRIYNYEFMDSEISLQVKLPEPIFLNTVNGLAMLNNVRDYVNAVRDIVYPEGVEVTDQEKGEFVRKYTERLLSTYIDLNMIHQIQEEIKVDKFSDKFKTEEGGEGGGGDEDMGEL